MAKASILAGLLDKFGQKDEALAGLQTAQDTPTPPDTEPHDTAEAAPDTIPPEPPLIELPNLDDILGGLPSFPIEHFEGTQFGWDNAPEGAGQSDAFLDAFF